MKPLLLALALPWLYWAQGIETAPALRQAGIERLAVPPAQADEWRQAGFIVTPLSEAELHGREKLLVPRIAGRGNIASATRRPWIDANGWRFVRHRAGQYWYDLPPRTASLAAIEAFAYGADAVLKIAADDLAELGQTLAFLRELPTDDLPPLADIGVIDDGTPLVGEVMNLLSRRNLLYRLVKAPSPQLRVNIRLGTKEFPRAAAADPSEFAQLIRRRLTDEQRTLRIYGTEQVIARLTGDGTRVRLHLINYGRREIEGLRVRVRGVYSGGEVMVAGVGRTKLEEFTAANGATEFSLGFLGLYAVVELKR